MEAIRRTNGFLEKWIYLIMPMIMVFGMTLGGSLVGMVGVTPFLFMVLTFISSLNADYRKLYRIVQKPAMFAGLLVVIHIIIPFIVFQAAGIALHSQPDLAMGVALSTMLPMGVTSIFWVNYNKGDLETALSFVTINTMLSPFIVPLTFSWILGSQVDLDEGSLNLSLVKLVLIPTLFGMLLGEWIKKKPNTVLFKASAAVLGKVCLYFIVLLNAAAISQQIHTVKNYFVQVLATVFLTIVFGYLLSYLYGRLFAFEREMNIAVAYTGGVRNYTVGVVLATTFFTPLVSLPVLLAMLLQHPIALLFFYFFRWLHKDRFREMKENRYGKVRS